MTDANQPIIPAPPAKIQIWPPTQTHENETNKEVNLEISSLLDSSTVYFILFLPVYDLIMKINNF
jgi:hypothetical protein